MKPLIVFPAAVAVFGLGSFATNESHSTGPFASVERINTPVPGHPPEITLFVAGNRYLSPTAVHFPCQLEDTSKTCRTSPTEVQRVLRTHPEALNYFRSILDYLALPTGASVNFELRSLPGSSACPPRIEAQRGEGEISVPLTHRIFGSGCSTAPTVIIRANRQSI